MLKNIINYESLPKEDLKKLWLVNPSDGGHIDGLSEMGILDNSGMWQVELDYLLENYGGIDISVMTKERFKEIMDNAGLEYEFVKEKLVER